MKNKLPVFILLMIPFVLFSQKLELGKVTQEELTQKRHPIDTSAAAAYIFKAGKSYFDISPEGYFNLITEFKAKIKIYKKEGYDQATIEIPFYTGGKQIKFFFEDVATYNLVNGKIEKTRLKKDGEFTEDINENYKLRKITLPNVKEGSVIEYGYTLRTPYYSFFPDWYFQHDIPTDFVKYEVRIPSYLIYSRTLKGYENIDVSKDETITTIDNRYHENKVVYTGKNIKSIKDVKFVNNIENYTSILQYELASTQFPNQPVERISIDWKSLTTSMYENEKFGDELNKKKYFENDLDQVLKTATSNQDKLNKIFSFVQQRMNWNDKQSYLCNDGVINAYKQKVGNSAEINLMLIAMLRYADLNANPILVSTIDNGIALFPNRGAYNYIIAGVENPDGTVHLLDATSKFTTPNILPIRTLNWEGVIIRPNKSTDKINLLPDINSKDLVTLMAEIQTDGTIKGKIRRQHMDYNAYAHRENNNTLSENSAIEKLEKRYTGLEVEQYTITNKNDLDKPLTENIDFSTNNEIEQIGNKLYFNPLLFYAMSQNPFKEETRDFPIDYIYPYQDRYNVTIKIPEGYKVEELPSPLAIATEGNYCSFKYNLSQNGNQIQVSATFEINHSSVPASHYSVLKDFYKKMLEKQNEKIVLVKI